MDITTLHAHIGTRLFAYMHNSDVLMDTCTQRPIRICLRTATKPKIQLGNSIPYVILSSEVQGNAAHDPPVSLRPALHPHWADVYDVHTGVLHVHF